MICYVYYNLRVCFEIHREPPMSLFRGLLLVGFGLMFLSSEEKKQPHLSTAATEQTEQSVSFCERNPSTCAASRELGTLLLRKAEYGLEQGARLLRDQLLRPNVSDQPRTFAADPIEPRRPQRPISTAQAAESEPTPLYLDPPPARRATQPMDNPSRWR